MIWWIKIPHRLRGIAYLFWALVVLGAAIWIAEMIF